MQVADVRCGKQVPFPIRRQAFALYELYMRDTRIWGDSLRLGLCLVLVFGPAGLKCLQVTSPLGLAAVASAVLALASSCVPYRGRLASEALIFEDIMELDESRFIGQHWRISIPAV